jgi:hypothetical protein
LPLSRAFHPFRTVLLIGLGALLTWLVISRSLVAFLATGAPEAALWLSPRDPEALLTLAERRLGLAGPLDASRSHLADAATRDEIRALAETALVGDPLNARALRVLGQVALAAGDRPRAMAYLEKAARHSIHESAVLSWLMRAHYERMEYAAALYYADALLRTRNEAVADVLPLLGRMAETPDAVDALTSLLASNPPWRPGFLRVLPRVVSDARTPLKVLLPLRQTPTPPSLADIREYVGLLVQHRFYEIASYTWLQFLPPEQLSGAGFLFNGGFEHTPSGLPFDWQIHGGTGFTASIVSVPDAPGQRALHVEMGPGRVEFGGVTQVLLLGPGSYRLSAKHRGELAGPRGLVWRLSCLGGASIGQTAMVLGATPQWKELELAFTVPETECRAQQLALALDARMPSEQLVSGSVWYDELQVSRAR